MPVIINAKFCRVNSRMAAKPGYVNNSEISFLKIHAMYLCVRVCIYMYACVSASAIDVEVDSLLYIFLILRPATTRAYLLFIRRLWGPLF